MRRTPPGPRRSPFDGRKSPRRVDPTRPRSPRSAPHQRRLLFNINYSTFKSSFTVIICCIRNCKTFDIIAT